MKNDDIIYHYCSIKTFIDIIKNRKIWMTDSNKMNDEHDSKYILKFKDYILQKNT